VLIAEPPAMSLAGHYHPGEKFGPADFFIASRID
jgi:hypothetical protein